MSSKKQAIQYRYYCKNPECNVTNSVSRELLKEVVIAEILKLKGYFLARKEEFIRYAASFDAKGRNIRLDLEGERQKALEKSVVVDGFIEKLFESSVKGMIPNSTFQLMLEKYKKEKVAVEKQIEDLTRRRSRERENPSNYERAKNLVKLLEQVKGENLFEPYIVHKLIKKIKVKAITANRSYKNKYVNITITYYQGDEFIKDFLTYEE